MHARPKTKLYTGFYIDSSAERHQENLECISRNLANPLIDEVWLFVDQPEQYRQLEQGKIRIAASAGERCTYRDFIEHANQGGENFLLIIANTDIYFDSTLSLIPECMTPDTLVCLTRREFRAEGQAPITEHYASSDVWIMQTPIRSFPCHQTLGKVHCESDFLGYAQRAGYKIRNVSLDVNAFHLHLSNKRNIDPDKDKYGDYWSQIFPTPGRVTSGAPTVPIAKKPTLVLDSVAFQLAEFAEVKYWSNVLSRWSQEDFIRHAVILARNGFGPLNFSAARIDAPPFNYALPVPACLVTQRLCDSVGADLYISSSEHSAAFHTPSIAMVRSTRPEDWWADLGQGPMFARHLNLSIAKHFVVPFEAIKASLLQHWPHINEQRVSVISAAAGETFAPQGSAAIADFCQRFQLQTPYLMFTGSRFGFGGHRNFEVLLRALASQPMLADYQVLCVGGEERLEARFENILPGRVRTAIVSDEDLAIAYSGAAALVYPPFGPGLGMAVMEAMRCGCPIIASRQGTPHELTGGHALYFDAWNADELGYQIVELARPGVRESLAGAARSHAQLFSWSRTAQMLKDVILRVAEEREAR